MSDCFDGSRRLNARVLAGLYRNEIVWDERCTGKSITLLTFVAVTSRPDRHVPIVVAENEAAVIFLRSMWRANFAGVPEPQWKSYRQFEHADGLSGDVFVDEPRASWGERWMRHAHACAARAQGRVCGVTSVGVTL